MFQGMRTHVASTCCTNHNSQAIIHETSSTENVVYTCFKQQMHDEMNDAHVYEMKMNLWEPNTWGVTSAPRPYRCTLCCRPPQRGPVTPMWKSTSTAWHPAQAMEDAVEEQCRIGGLAQDPNLELPNPQRHSLPHHHQQRWGPRCVHLRQGRNCRDIH
jgi:hypothetical protein